jgi:hypothetical protein
LCVFCRFLRFLSLFLTQFPISTLSFARLHLLTFCFLVNPLFLF